MNEARLSRIHHVVAQRQKGIIVILEDIHDPHNAAAIMRTCDALGIQDVWFIFEKEEQYNPKSVGKATSSSANKWLDFRIFDSTQRCFETLKHKGYVIISSALSDSAESLMTACLREEKIALIVGNEHTGISEYAIKNSDRILEIPMRGFVQSLNVSVATAVFLWEITRQRMADGRNNALLTPERDRLMEDFKKRAEK